ncbi:MAG: hypothetical protein KDJ12_03415 [Hyphomicrobiales bacterium]|nr:hypothetical protein [Hyphomicrobiales bacterium]
MQIVSRQILLRERRTFGRQARFPQHDLDLPLAGRIALLAPGRHHFHAAGPGLKRSRHTHRRAQESRIDAQAVEIAQRPHGGDGDMAAARQKKRGRERSDTKRRQHERLIYGMIFLMFDIKFLIRQYEKT